MGEFNVLGVPFPPVVAPAPAPAPALFTPAVAVEEELVAEAAVEAAVVALVGAAEIFWWC